MTNDKNPAPTSEKPPFWQHPEVKSLFWTLLLILFIRGFIAEPFKIPSGSMIPTLLIGDHLFVAKTSFDIGVPFTNKKLVHVSDPKRGDVVVFEYPNHEGDESKDGVYYIKRLIGLPGDEITIKGGIPQVNGQIAAQQSIDDFKEGDPRLPGFEFNTNHRLLFETLPGMDHPHWVQRYPYRYSDLPEAIQELQASTGKSCIEMGRAAKREIPIISSSLFNEICSFRVPEGMYFAMGDNRDDSADSREWGLVPRENIKGRALFIWFSWKGFSWPFLRWTRLGQGIK